MDSIRRSANKYAVLEEYVEDERQDLNMMKDRMVVDVYLNKKVKPIEEVIKTWSKDMQNYFNTQWEVDRNIEKGFPVEEEEEVMENVSETGKLLVADEIQGKDNAVLN